MLYAIKADQNQNYLHVLVKHPADNHSPDKELGMFVLILNYLTLPIHVCSFHIWYPIEVCFGMSCRPFRYPLRSIPVHFGTLGSPLRPVSVLYEQQHDKTNKMTCAPSEDSDQPGHLPSLITLRCPHEERLG